MHIQSEFCHSFFFININTFCSLVGILNKVIVCDSCIHAFEIVLVDGICGNLYTDYMYRAVGVGGAGAA